jgi:hypothetical protein
MATQTSLEKAELLLGTEHIKSMLKTKPPDNSIIIKHTYRVKATTYFEYDLFKFAYPDSDARQIERLECSYFLEQLLSWFGHSHTTQQKHEKISLWEKITGESLYSGNLTESIISREKFFNIVGFFIYGNIYISVSHKFDTGKKAKLAMLTALGEACFFLIADYLDSKFGEAYNNGGELPVPKERKYNESATEEIRDKFDRFLATNPKITTEKQKEDFNYSVFAFTTDFDSVHNATYTWAADFLLLELLMASGNKKYRTILNALKANVRTPRGETITETEFYQLFGCCVLLIAKEVKQEFKLCALRRLGKSCFLKLVEHLENS